ncbi:protein lin-37 homolog [Watersipora subatra]|uniref:protein lin-37 homolog n=1 Tax=Watersipora subatra TaxID=2589382 RepID=UPI00355BE8A5
MARKSVSGSLKEEINNARANLDNLLLKISNAKETGVSLSEDEDGGLTEQMVPRDGSADGSPTRRRGGGHAGKKRKKGHGNNPVERAGNVYVVKLFDRSVDLAPYDESSPLYPMCRSWMRNSANEQYIEQPTSHEALSGGETQFPEPYMATDDEDLYKLRIPEPIKRNEKPLDIYAEPEDAPSLLLNHIAHWKKVRESWRAAAAAYDARFATSHALIKKMYEAGTK